jgi:hypothetical protein
MRDNTSTTRLTRSRQAGLPTAAACLSLALALTGCGGSSSSGVARLSSEKGTSSASSEGGGPASGSITNPRQATVDFAKCMRANGVPNFPDSGLITRGAGVDPSSPFFQAARAKCQKLMPGGGPPGPGSSTHPSPQTLARFLKIAQCMRGHGVPQFRDPTTSVPSNPHPPAGGTFVISDIEGMILVMGSIDEQSPVFKQAAAACTFPLRDH